MRGAGLGIAIAGVMGIACARAAGDDGAKGAPPATPPSALTAEEESYLAESLRALMPSGVPFTYDRATGTFSVTYDSGVQLRRDVSFPGGYDEMCYRWRENPRPGQFLPFRPNEPVPGMSFEGSRKGFLLLPVPFQERLAVEYQVEIGIIATDPQLAVVLMASGDGQSACAANFGTVEVWREGKSLSADPPSDPSYRGHPRRWFTKFRLVGMKVEYKPDGSDPKSARIDTWYDTDLAPVKPINSRPVPQRSGLVGFSWSNCKFRVRGLKVSGKLDKRAALAAVRNKNAVDRERESKAAPRRRRV